MNATSIPRHKTALVRRQLSRPIRLALDQEIISASTTVFDYGCGRGSDVQRLRTQGITCHGWDPVHLSDGVREPADVVNLGYVINVIETPDERAEALREAWQLTQGVLVVTTRLHLEELGADLVRYGDGFLTSRGTFQKFYDHSELRAFIDATLSVSSVPAAPGVFYVFRSPEDHQSFLARQYRRRLSTPKRGESDRLFEIHRSLFDPVLRFTADRGRLPAPDELGDAPALFEAVGTPQRALNIIRRVLGPRTWEAVRQQRTEDLLVYLALSRFDGRPRLGGLPVALQRDVLALFPTYRAACAAADELLFSAGEQTLLDTACRTAPVGKLTPTALYAHESAIDELPAILRVYEGCARGYVGKVEGANIFKLHRWKPQVSYLSYPRFDRDPHPALAGSLVVPLRTFHIKYRDYTDSDNPPILHRKEEFVSADYPLRSRFARLTTQEKANGLYATTARIGTREEWGHLLISAGLSCRGHRLGTVPRSERPS